MERAYLILNIEEYGKLMSFCIENDISIWRTYWDDREAGDRCYHIDWSNKRCHYATKDYYEAMGYKIVEPKFVLNEYGKYKLEWC